MHIIQPEQAINFEGNKRLLNRYRFIEYETLRILAGWLPATANMDVKLAMGRLLWEDAQHIQHLYLRLREVQTPAFRPPGDEALAHLMAEAIHAPSELDLLAGLFRIIKPALVDAYRWHMEQTFANPDAPTLYAFKHILIDEKEQLRWAEDALAHHPVGEWEAYVADLLNAAGCVTGSDELGRRQAQPTFANRSPFVAPRKAARDDRFSLVNRHAGQRVTDSDLATRRQLEFESYSQEMLAAETVALVNYLSPDMPWALASATATMKRATASWALSGWTQHGFDYTDVPQNTRIYAWRSQYDPATQYTPLTMGNEVHAFPYRHESIKAYAEHEDTLSIQYISYDMADERTHVAYGKKWIPELMKAYGIDKPVDQYIDETVALWEAEYR